MRFRQFLSDVTDAERKNWQCEQCLEKQLFVSRNCPLGATLEKETQEEDQTVSTTPAAARNKYFVKKEKAVPQAEDSITLNITVIPDEKPVERPVIKHGDFTFTECPVPMFMESFMTPDERFAVHMVDIVNWSEATGIPPVQGGLLDQSNVFFESRSIIINEQNKIKAEKQEEERKRMEEANRKNSKGRGKR